METIWTDWESHYRDNKIDATRITKDGILNPILFGEKRPKLLFVLKESDDFPGGDLRALLKDGPVYQMWHTISRWASGFLNEFPSYEKIDNYSSMIDALSRVAIINIKKITGGSETDEISLNIFARLDQDLIRNQIREISPDYIIACGTFNQLIWILDLQLFPLDNKSVYFDRMTQSNVIKWRHPNRANNKRTYQELSSIMENFNKLKST